MDRTCGNGAALCKSMKLTRPVPAVCGNPQEHPPLLDLILSILSSPYPRAAFFKFTAGHIARPPVAPALPETTRPSGKSEDSVFNERIVNFSQDSGPKTVILSVDFRSGFGVKYRCINIDVPHTDPEAVPPSGPAFFGNSGDPRRDERSHRPPLRGGGRCTSRHPPETGGALFGTSPLYQRFL